VPFYITAPAIPILSVSEDLDPSNWSKIDILGQYPELETLMSEPTNPAASTTRRPDPNEKLVKVFDSEDESEAMIVKGLLESAGIDSDLSSASLVQDTFPGLGGMIILVREQDAETARTLIEENRQPESSEDDDETAEIDIIEDSPKRP
jgi:hypothetical protein